MKRLQYADMAFEAEQRGWKAIVFPVEVGCRGFLCNILHQDDTCLPLLEVGNLNSAEDLQTYKGYSPSCLILLNETVHVFQVCGLYTNLKMYLTSCMLLTVSHWCRLSEDVEYLC